MKIALCHWLMHLTMYVLKTRPKNQQFEPKLLPKKEETQTMPFTALLPSDSALLAIHHLLILSSGFRLARQGFGR